jgi:membrane protein
LIKEAFADSLDVLQAHVELAVLEVREDARAGVRVAAAFGVGAALTMLAAGFLLAGLAFGLALVIPAWAACLVVGAIVLVCAAVAFGIARRKLATHDFRPERTLAALKEDRDWIGKKS